MAFGIPFASVLQVVALLFEVLPERQPTLLARLRNMSREGFPPGAAVGRGTRVAYSIEQLTAIIFYHLLIDGLIPPAAAVRLFKLGEAEILSVVRDTCLADPPPDSKPRDGPGVLWLRIHPGGLWQLNAGDGKVPEPAGWARANRVAADSALGLSIPILSRSDSRFVWGLDIGGVMWEALAWLIRTGATTAQEVQEALLATSAARQGEVED